MANKKVSQLTSKPSVLTTDLFPIADPSTGQLFKTTISDLGTAIGSGVSSVNTLVGAVVLDTDDIQELVSPTNKWFTDTRARAALSASSPLTYNSGTGAFGIQVATGSQNGYLSSTDWTTFNAKQAALSGTGFVKISGTTISYDNSTYLTTIAAASTYLALGGGTMTGALIGTSAGFTGYVGIGNTSPLYQLDVTGSGRFEGDLHILSTNPRIYLTDSDNNPDYFISNTDGTFTIYDVTNSASRLTISSSQISPRLPIVSNSSIQGTAFYSDSFFSATTFVQATTFMASPSYRLTGGTSPTGLYFGHTDKVVLANYTVGGGIDFETNGGNITMQLSSGGVLSTTGGASFSGALSGTSATFTGGFLVNGTTDVYPEFITNSSDGDVLLGFSNTGDSNNGWGVGRRNTGEFWIANYTGNFRSGTRTTPFTINTSNYIDISGLRLKGSDSSNTIYVGNQNMAITAESGYNISIGRSSDTTKALNVSSTSGYVGIGKTSPGFALDITSGSDGMVANFNSNRNGGGGFSITNNGSARIYFGNANWMGISGESTSSTAIALASAENSAIIFGTNAAYSVSEKMRITSSAVLIGQTTASGSSNGIYFRTGIESGIIVTNDIALQLGRLGSTGDIQSFYTGTTRVGTISVSGSATSYNTTSDYRLKQDLKSFNGLDVVNKIKTYDYEWKADNTRSFGVLAHELQEVLPYAVMGEKDGERMQGVDYSKIVPVMVQAIKDLKAELDLIKQK